MPENIEPGTVLVGEGRGPSWRARTKQRLTTISEGVKNTIQPSRPEKLLTEKRQTLVDKINALESKYTDLSDEEFAKKALETTKQFKEQVANHLAPYRQAVDQAKQRKERAQLVNGNGNKEKSAMKNRRLLAKTRRQLKKYLENEDVPAEQIDAQIEKLLQQYDHPSILKADIKLQEQKKRLKEEKQKILDEILPEAFALVREASWREIGLRHHDVQLIGGMILHDGEVAEMRTGEGKTITAALPLYLNALAGDGAHLVTVNEYLVKRDGGWLGRVFNRLVAVPVIPASFSYIRK